MCKPFHVVDVFSGVPYRGNPVAVLLGVEESEGSMQALARWTGMPETVFITEPTDERADYALRIFSPVRELAFAGHPSIGACHLLLELGLVKPSNGVVQQQCRAGLFEMRVAGDEGSRCLGFNVTAETVDEVHAAGRATFGAALGAIPSRAFFVEAGAKWLIAHFENAETIAGLKPNLDKVRSLADAAGALGISVYGPSPDPDAQHEVRSFAPSIGVAEDAVCGGGNACVGAVLAHLAEGAVAVTVSQGRHLGRCGRVRLSSSTHDRGVTVSGEAITTISGVIRLSVKEAGRGAGDPRSLSPPGGMSASTTSHATLAMQDVTVSLARRRRRVVGGLTTMIIAAYFAFMGLFAFDKTLLGIVLAPGLTLCLVLGPLLILSGCLVSLAYVLWANLVFDPAVTESGIRHAGHTEGGRNAE